MLIILSLIDRVRKRRLTYALNQIVKSISSLASIYVFVMFGMRCCNISVQILLFYRILDMLVKI